MITDFVRFHEMLNQTFSEKYHEVLKTGRMFSTLAEGIWRSITNYLDLDLNDQKTRHNY